MEMKYIREIQLGLPRKLAFNDCYITLFQSWRLQLTETRLCLFTHERKDIRQGHVWTELTLGETKQIITRVEEFFPQLDYTPRNVALNKYA